MLADVRRHCPDCFVVVYDIGDRNSTAPKLNGDMVRNALKTRFSLRRFPFDRFPPHMQVRCCQHRRKQCEPNPGWAGQYAWKPVIIAALVAEFGAALWLDAGTIPTSGENALATIRHQLQHGSGFFGFAALRRVAGCCACCSWLG